MTNVFLFGVMWERYGKTIAIAVRS